MPEYMIKLIDKLPKEKRKALLLVYQDIEAGKEIKPIEEYLKAVRAGK